MKWFVSKWDFLVICRHQWRWQLEELGIACRDRAGFLKADEMPQALEKIKEHPHLHVASFHKDGGYNTYVEGQSFYTICEGESDPNMIICHKTKPRLLPTDEEWAEVEREFAEILADYTASPP